MDCKCCFDQQSQYQQIRSPAKVLSYRDINQMKINRERTYYKNDQPKISLRKKTQHLQNNKLLNQIPIKIDSVKTTAANLPQHNFNYNNIMFRPNSFHNQPKVFFSPPPVYQPTQIRFQQPPIFKFQTISHVNAPLIKQTQFRPPQLKKIIKPEVKIFYQNPTPQNPLPPVPQLQKSLIYFKQIQPIKVSFNQGASPTMPQNQVKQQKYSTKQRKIPIRKSSIQFNQSTPSYQQFRGKRSHIQLKKLNSLNDNQQMPQAQYQSTAFVRSLKLHVPHIQDIQCKNTQSIADANDSIDQLSQVIWQNNIGDLDNIHVSQKMTNSDIKPGYTSRKNQGQNTKSIIWQSSRKQSYNQI